MDHWRQDALALPRQGLFAGSKTDRLAPATRLA
jgi:hypothetical protein